MMAVAEEEALMSVSPFIAIDRSRNRLSPVVSERFAVDGGGGGSGRCG